MESIPYKKIQTHINNKLTSTIARPVIGVLCRSRSLYKKSGVNTKGHSQTHDKRQKNNTTNDHTKNHTPLT